jgi:dsDNA-specific endonuclease/ATPase MutS2
LISKDAGLSSHDKFLKQIQSFKEFTNLMIDKRQKKFRIIHGAGEGKLKNEIRAMLSLKKGFTMNDDQYSFGRVGASIIEIKLSLAEKF